jgi:hypothetical protein
MLPLQTDLFRVDPNSLLRVTTWAILARVKPILLSSCVP